MFSEKPLCNALEVENGLKSAFARACAAVRSFYKKQKLRENSHGNDEDTARKVFLRGVF